MISVAAHVRFDVPRVHRRVRQASAKGLSHAAAAIRLTARRSIRRRKGAADPGQPPHTRQGRLKESILYSVDQRRQEAVIGPAASVVGTAGSAHEHGGRFRGARYPRRPFMSPVLQNNLNRLPKHWRATVY
jgi:phage gpG-like protein